MGGGVKEVMSVCYPLRHLSLPLSQALCRGASSCGGRGVWPCRGRGTWSKVHSVHSGFSVNITSMAKPDILVCGNQHPKLVNGLSEFATIHKVGADGNDFEALGKIGTAIRGVATSSFVGFPSHLFSALPALEIISCFGVGTDKIDVKKSLELGIKVTNTPDVLTDDVADLALALILATSRRICEADRYVREKQWPVRGMMPLTRKVTGKRVGIIGMGRIGLAIAKRAESFDCKLAYQSRSEKPNLPYQFFSTVTELARNSDFLVAACPLTPETKHIVNREVLDALGPEGVLVNIARGGVVDEKEMVKALVEGRLGGAGLDVFEDEPHVPDELLSLPQVVLLPHVGSGTEETRADMAELTLANLKAHFAGQPLLTPVES